MPHKDLQENTLGGRTVALKSSTSVSAGNFSVFQNRGTMETYLLANGYTQAKLNILTKNDLVNACRLKLALA